MEVVKSMRNVLTPLAYQMISKNTFDYSKAVSFCRYEVITYEGQKRLGLAKIDHAR